MKFSIELDALIRIVETVSKKMPNRQGVDARLRVIASPAQVVVASNQTEAGIKALVSQEGRCTLRRTKFLSVLRTYVGKANLTIEADKCGLRIGGFSMPVLSYSGGAETPGEVQVTDQGLAAQIQQAPSAPSDNRWLSTPWWMPTKAEQAAPSPAAEVFKPIEAAKGYLNLTERDQARLAELRAPATAQGNESAKESTTSVEKNLKTMPTSCSSKDSFQSWLGSDLDHQQGLTREEVGLEKMAALRKDPFAMELAHRLASAWISLFMDSSFTFCYEAPTGARKPELGAMWIGLTIICLEDKTFGQGRSDSIFNHPILHECPELRNMALERNGFLWTQAKRFQAAYETMTKFDPQKPHGGISSFNNRLRQIDEPEALWIVLARFAIKGWSGKAEQKC